MELLREQIESEREARLAERVAVLEVTLDERLSGNRDPAYPTAPSINRYVFTMTNVGRAPAVGVSVWLTGAQSQRTWEFPQGAWESHVEERAVLLASESWRFILGAYGPLRDSDTDSGSQTKLMLAWEDGAGVHEEPADIHLERPRVSSS